MKNLFLKISLFLLIISLCSCTASTILIINGTYKNIINNIKRIYKSDEEIIIKTPSLRDDLKEPILKVNNTVIEPYCKDNFTEYFIENCGGTLNIQFELLNSSEFQVLNDVLTNPQNFDFNDVIEVGYTSFTFTQPNFFSTIFYSTHEDDIKLVLSKLSAPVSKELYQGILGASTKKYYLKNSNGDEYILPIYQGDYRAGNEGYALLSNIEPLKNVSTQCLGFQNTWVEPCKFIEISTNKEVGSLPLECIKFNSTTKVPFSEPKLKANQIITGFGELFIFEEDLFGIKNEEGVFKYFQTIGSPFSVFF